MTTPPTLTQSIDLLTLKRVARLAHLELSEKEEDKFKIQLSHILLLIEKLRATDTKGVEPLSHPGDITLRLRQDEVTQLDERASLLPLSDNSTQGYYVVPQFLE